MSNVKKIGDERFLVQSDEDSEIWYEVDLNMPWCECKGFYFTKRPCKHIKLAEKFSQEQAAEHPHP